jgi:hypothetical protein
LDPDPHSKWKTFAKTNIFAKTFARTKNFAKTKAKPSVLYVLYIRRLGVATGVGAALFFYSYLFCTRSLIDACRNERGPNIKATMSVLIYISDT